jgi:soluble lytic murein transglycosylase-like protein
MRGTLQSLAIFLALPAAHLFAPDYQAIRIIVPEPHAPTEQEIKAYIIEAANRVGVDSKLALHVAWMESRFKPGLIHTERGGSKSRGLFQWNDIALSEMDIDPMNYRQNADAAVARLAKYTRRYGGDTNKVLCAWTRGPYARCE